METGLRSLDPAQLQKIALCQPGWPSRGPGWVERARNSKLRRGQEGRQQLHLSVLGESLEAIRPLSPSGAPRVC